MRPNAWASSFMPCYAEEYCKRDDWLGWILALAWKSQETASRGQSVVPENEEPESSDVDD